MIVYDYHKTLPIDIGNEEALEAKRGEKGMIATLFLALATAGLSIVCIMQANEIKDIRQRLQQLERR